MIVPMKSQRKRDTGGEKKGFASPGGGGPNRSMGSGEPLERKCPAKEENQAAAKARGEGGGKENAKKKVKSTKNS